MQKRIIDITPEMKALTEKKRVAAYARVSCDKDTMLHSLAAQIDYYKTYITKNAEWVFAGVYADEYTPYGLNPNRHKMPLESR